MKAYVDANMVCYLIECMQEANRDNLLFFIHSEEVKEMILDLKWEEREE